MSVFHVDVTAALSNHHKAHITTQNNTHNNHYKSLICKSINDYEQKLNNKREAIIEQYYLAKSVISIRDVDMKCSTAIENMCSRNKLCTRCARCVRIGWRK